MKREAYKLLIEVTDKIIECFYDYYVLEGKPHIKHWVHDDNDVYLGTYLGVDIPLSKNISIGFVVTLEHYSQYDNTWEAISIRSNGIGLRNIDSNWFTAERAVERIVRLMDLDKTPKEILEENGVSKIIDLLVPRKPLPTTAHPIKHEKYEQQQMEIERNRD